MKLYDCFMYCDEDLLLDLRLNILNDYVDYFVLVEGKKDHQGKPRSLNFNIEKFNKFPRLDRIKYLAEHKISLSNQTPNEIINWFNKNQPKSGFGEMILGESLIKSGNEEKGIKLIKQGFVKEIGRAHV